MKSIYRVIAKIILFITVLTFCAGATAEINIGDYVNLGRYNGVPVLWRCVDIDENGPLMLSDRIISIKPFDAAGNHTYLDGTPQADDGYRTLWGSNLWQTSNLRSWLNSAAAAGEVVWLGGCPPTADALLTRLNAYADESGFLSERNFTREEVSAIKTVTQKTMLHSIDAAQLAEGGTGYHRYSYELATSLLNYESAFYHNVTDKVFLPSILQIYKVLINSSILGEGYYMAKPTQKAVDTSEYKSVDLSAESTLGYWLRTPYAVDYYSPGNVRDIKADGFAGASSCDNTDIGVRPAFYLNTEAAGIKHGGGTDTKPYYLTDLWSIKSINASSSTVSVTVENYYNDYSSLPTLILAAYDADGALLSAKRQIIISGVSEYTFDMSGFSNVAEYKAFLWEDLNNILPVAESFS